MPWNWTLVLLACDHLVHLSENSLAETHQKLVAISPPAEVLQRVIA